MHPIAISLILHEGNPLGIRTAEIGNSVIRATVIPRALWKQGKEIDMLQNPGVYFLISTMHDDASYDVYIGEAENIANRVSYHINDTAKDYWNYAICFATKDSSLHKAHAKFLESYLCHAAAAAGRVHLKNSTAPKSPQLPQHERIVAMQYYDHIHLLLSALGFPILTPLSLNKQKLYFCKGPHANAIGALTEEGFVVLKDSIARRKKTASIQERMTQRTAMIEEGILSEEGNESFRFAQDYLFPSPSMAAVIVLSRSANGWIEWKDEEGKTLDENVRVKDS